MTAPSGPPAESGHPDRARAVLVHGGVVVGLLAVSIGLWWSVWGGGHPASTMVCQCGDPALNLWFLQWVPWSIAHGHSPFLSNAVYAGQGGANTLDTDSLLPGLLASPITEAFGPVAAFNVLVTVTPVLNGWAMFLLARKISSFLPGALLATLLYALSPYVINHVVYGHFNAGWLFFPPLLLWCGYDLAVDRRHRPVAVGVLLGLLVVVQFFTGPELLAMCAVLSVLGGAVVLALAPRLVLARRRELASGLGTGAAISVVVLAYPAWFLAHGPRHVSGLPWPKTTLGNAWHAIVDAGAYNVPTKFDLVGGYYGGLPEPTYLGAGLLVLLALLGVVWYRRRLARCTAVAGLIAWLLSLGVGPTTGDRTFLPWRLFVHLPLVSEIMAARFGQFLYLAAGILLVLSLDLVWSEHRAVGRVAARWRRLTPQRAGAAVAWLCCAATVAALVPIAATYRVPFRLHAAAVPAWFAHVGARLPSGTTILAVPDAGSGVDDAMAWQALDDFSFDMVSGYALVPGNDGHSSDAVDPLHGPSAFLNEISWGLPPLPSGTLAQVRQTRQALERWGVRIVVVATEEPNPYYAVGFMTAVLGRLPLWQDGAWVWYGLGASPPTGPGPAVLTMCALAPGRASPLAVPRCVLGSGSA